MSVKTRLWVLGTIIVCGGLILLGVVAGLLPQLSAAGNTMALVQNQKDVNDIQRIQLAQLQAARDTADELKSQLDELEKAIPSTAASSEWIRALRRAEEKTDAVVNQFEVNAPFAQAPPAETTAEGEPAPQGPGVQAVPVTLEVIGAEERDVSRFMREVQEGSRLLVVTNIEIIEDQNKESNPWRAEITGHFYTKLS